MRKLPTVSEMPRATACAASVVKPRRAESDEPSASALRGQRIHAYVAARFRKWPLPAIGKTKVSHIQLGALRRYAGHGQLYCEPAFSYDGASASFIAENIGRDYQRPGTLCGSADIVVVRRDLVHVIDIKTGSLPVPSPRDNWQLATLAMMVNLALNGQNAPIKGTIATLNRDGSWDFGESHTWSQRELAAIKHRINNAHAMWAEAEQLEASGWGATPTPGQHCRWCKCVCEFAEIKQEQAA
jgi:hypothetical protein